MIALDHEPHRWPPLKDHNVLLLDVQRSYDPVDCDWIIALNGDELAQFHAVGRTSITLLPKTC